MVEQDFNNEMQFGVGMMVGLILGGGSEGKMMGAMAIFERILAVGSLHFPFCK